MNPLMSFDEFRAIRVRWHEYFLSDDATLEERNAFIAKIEHDILAEWQEWRDSLDPMKRKLRDLAWQHYHAEEPF